MTMHIVYKKFHDGHKPGEDAFTERSLARRLCSEGKAVPYVVYMKAQAEAKQRELEAEADKQAKEAKAKAKLKSEEEKPAKVTKKAPKRKFTKPEKAVKIEK
jgi:regulator of protease activity HflC (stomatin/prohibitin superfamily)